jgi:hypothetical protein
MNWRAAKWRARIRRQAWEDFWAREVKRANGGRMKLKPDEIIVDETVYPRNQPSWLTVYQYAEALEAGAVFPPLVVGKRHDLYVLLDGRHRLLAHQKRQTKIIEVQVSKVPPAGFFAEAVRLNVQNGRPLAPHERVHAAKILRDQGYEDAKISKLLWIPIGTLRRLLIDRVDTVTVDGQVRSIVRKGLLPKGRLLTASDQESFASRTQLALFTQIISLCEHDLLETTPEIQDAINILAALLAPRVRATPTDASAAESAG